MEAKEEKTASQRESKKMLKGNILLTKAIGGLDTVPSSSKV